MSMESGRMIWNHEAISQFAPWKADDLILWGFSFLYLSSFSWISLRGTTRRDLVSLAKRSKGDCVFHALRSAPAAV